QLVVFFDQRHLVPPLGGHHGRLQAGGAAADDDHFLLHGRRLDGLVLVADIGVDGAADGVADAGAQEAAFEIADTGADLRLLAVADLVGPLGVGDDRAGHEHHVALAVVYGLVGEFAGGDPAAADDGQLGHGFLHLGGGVEVGALGGHVGRGVVVLGHLGLLAPGGDPQPVELAGGFQQLGHGDALRQAVAAEGGDVGVEGDAEHEVGAGIGADAVDDLDDHPHAVLQAAAVLVGTLVVEGGGEALHAGAAANGELKAVGPGLLGVHGGDDMGFRQLLDFADGHRARLGIAQHGVGCDTGGHSLVEIRLHPYSLDEGPGTPFVGRLDDFLDGVEVVPAVGANEPARRYQRGRLNLTAGDPHEADAALGAGLEIADLLLGADTETHHAVGGHEDSILDVEIADLHRI